MDYDSYRYSYVYLLLCIIQTHTLRIHTHYQYVNTQRAGDTVLGICLDPRRAHPCPNRHHSESRGAVCRYPSFALPTRTRIILFMVWQWRLTRCESNPGGDGEPHDLPRSVAPVTIQRHALSNTIICIIINIINIMAWNVYYIQRPRAPHDSTIASG